MVKRLMLFTTAYYIHTVQLKQCAHGHDFHFGLASLQHFTSQHRFILLATPTSLALTTAQEPPPLSDQQPRIRRSVEACAAGADSYPADDVQTRE
jgi:hypothetical protein